MYMDFVRFYFGEKSAALKAAQGRDCRPSQQEYGGEKYDGVPRSFAYSCLVVRSHLTVYIVAPRAELLDAWLALTIG